MAENISTAFVQQYSRNVQLLAQQMGSRLRSAVMTGSHVGKLAAVVEQVGSVNPVQRVTRDADTPILNPPQEKRWAQPKSYSGGVLIDDPDKLRMLIDPTSAFAQTLAEALARQIDDEVIAAFDAAATTGEDGDATTALPAAQTIAVGGAGMTVSKLRTARRLLRAAEVDLDREPAFVALSARQEEDLLNETQAISLDYRNRPVLEDGKLTAFMGFQFVHSERLLTSAGDRLCPCWVKSGMHLGIWGDVEGSIDKRPDKNNAMQVFAKATFGATRIEEVKVVMITCDEP